MAVHHSRRRYHRAPPLRPRSRPPQRPLHVRQAETSNRIRIHIPIPVSALLTHPRDLQWKTDILTKPKQPHSLLPPPHLLPPLRPSLNRRHPRRHRTNPLAPSRSPLRPNRLQRLLSTSLHGSRKHKLRYGR